MKKICVFVIICCIAMAAQAQTYCTPVYYYALDSTYAMNKVQLTDIHGTATDTFTVPTDGYIDHTGAAPFAFIAGFSYSGRVHYNAPTYDAYKNQAWIDFDGDGIFAVSEQVTAPFGNVCGSFDTGNAFTVSIPATVPAGAYRMRIRNADTYGCSLAGDMSPCDSSDAAGAIYYYGAAVDYMVAIRDTDLCTGTPTIDSVVYTGPAALTTHDTFTISLAGDTTVIGVRYQWQSSTTSATSGFTNIYGACHASYAVHGLSATT